MRDDIAPLPFYVITLDGYEEMGGKVGGCGWLFGSYTSNTSYSMNINRVIQRFLEAAN